MNYGLTETQKEIVDLAYRIAVEKIKPVREHYDNTEEYPWPIIEEFRKADLFGVYFPEKYGGLGGAAFDLVLVTEQLSRICAGIASSFAASGLCAIPILLFANEEQRQRFLPDLASGMRLGAFALTQPQADATTAKCTATLDGDCYVINGQINFCSNGSAADIYTFFAMTDPSSKARNLSAFVIEKGTQGFTFGKKEHKMGIRASWTCDLVFNNCRIQKKNLLYKEGFGLIIAQNALDVSRLGVAAQALGLATGVLDETLAYTQIRKQFGQAIATFQAIQHMLTDCATAIEASRALLYSTTRAMDNALAPAIKAALDKGSVVYDEMTAMNVTLLTKESGMCKVLCSDTAMKVATDCVQMCGGIGFMRDFPVEKYMRDAKTTQIYEGTNQIHRNEIALMMIKEAAVA